MNFKDFYKILRSMFTKEELDIDVTNENFSFRLAIRYLSFYHPEMYNLLNESVNKFQNCSLLSEPQTQYNMLKCLVPKLNKAPYINYVKKQITSKMNEKGITDEDITLLANKMEISKRDVYSALDQITKLNK